ncbi:MAG: AraC family transcriptional regulator [Microvirga sp.]
MRATRSHPIAAERTIMRRSLPAADVVRLSIAREIAALLLRFGVGPHEAARIARFAPSAGSDGAGPMPVSDLGRLMTLCVARTNCDHFGLLVGQSSVLTPLGLVGCLMPPSQTVGKALRNLAWHLRRHHPATAPMLTANGGSATLTYALPDIGIESADQVADGAMATALNIMRALCGPDWTCVEVLLPRSAPPDPGPFERLFRAPVRWETGVSALVFPAFWLKRPIPDADVILHRMFVDRFDPAGAGAEGSVSDQLRHVLRTRLVNEDCSASRIADLFAMTRRTLNRRLTAEGTAFSTLVNETRFEIACGLLANPRMTFEQIAATLAFSEASAFTRAFRRWSGQTPTAWRAGHLRA